MDDEQQRIIYTIVKFLNVLAKELSVEDCKNIKELRNFLPIIARFMETGHMEFVSNDGYGFYSILDFLSKKGADDRMVSTLDAKAAEAGDSDAIIRFFVALIYELCLLHPDKLVAYCDKLDEKANQEIAELLCKMENLAGMNNMNAKLKIRTQNVGNFIWSDGNADADTHMAGRMRSRSLTRAVSPSRLRTVDSSSTSRYVPFLSPLANKAKPTFLFESPVSKVVNSPLGEERAKIRQQAKQIAEWKDRYEQCYNANGELEERNSSLIEQNETLKRQRQELLNDQARATVLIHDKTIEIQRMSNRISKLNSRNLTLSKSNSELQRLLNNSMESRRILIEQRDDIDQQFTVLVSTNAQLNKENDELREHIRIKENTFAKEIEDAHRLREQNFDLQDQVLSLNARHGQNDRILHEQKKIKDSETTKLQFENFPYEKTLDAQMKQVEERELSDTEQLLRMVETDKSFIYTQHPATTNSITLENDLEIFYLDNFLFDTGTRHYSLLQF